MIAARFAKGFPEFVRPLLFAFVGVVALFLVSSTGLIASPFQQFILHWQRELLVVPLGYLSFYFFLLLAFSGIAQKTSFAIFVVGSMLGGGQAWLRWEAVPHSIRWDVATSTVMGWLGGLAMLVLCKHCFTGSSQEKAKAFRLAVIALFLGGLTLFSNGALDLSSALHPGTFDAYLFHFDQALGFQPSELLAKMGKTTPFFHGTLKVVYDVLPFGFAVFYAVSVKNDEKRVNLIAFWVYSALLAFFAYQLVPVCGPVFFFGAHWPLDLPKPSDIPLASVLIDPAPRNGVPSMHFGWAFSYFLVSFYLRSPLWRWGASLFLLLTILATLETGQHYLTDLLIAVPFVLGIFAANVSVAEPALQNARRQLIKVSFSLFFIWIAVLIVYPEVSVIWPWAVWFGYAATLGLCFYFARGFIGAGTALSRVASTYPRAHAEPAKRVWLVVAIFVLSGFAGLVYEVLFAKSLAIVFGGTALAAYTVLVVYMGGMAIGAWLGGGVAQRTSRPMFVYAICEVAIGLYCLLTPFLFVAMKGLYVWLAADLPPDAVELTVFRVLLGSAVLLVPTVLMGMTLPILTRYLSDSGVRFGFSVASLYGANTVGAALGALFSGYALIPLLGLYKTTMTAAFLNLLVGLLALRIQKRIRQVGVSAEAGKENQIAEGGRKNAWVPFVILGVGGVLTMLLETNYVHLLAVVAGNSVYAFALMLSAFLFGLAGGAGFSSWLLRRELKLELLLFWLELGFAISVLAGIFVWEHIPPYFASYEFFPEARGFGARELLRALACGIALTPPAFFIGAIYPLAMAWLGRVSPNAQMQALGRASALNTVGNISGVLLGGFVLLPWMGAYRSVQIVGGVAVALAAMIAFFALRKQALRPLSAALIGLVIFLSMAQPGQPDYEILGSGANVYFKFPNWGRVIDHAESVDGGLTTVTVKELGDPPVRIKHMLTNGKFQGNDAKDGEMIAQIGFALAPLLHTAERESALVIGYGTGVSANTMRIAGFRNLDIVELSKDVLDVANKHFPEMNHRVSEVEGVRSFITDGRNFLLLQNRRYDLIGMEITSIWFAGAASLYNREFYHLVRQRLADNGVLQQWVQLHHISTLDVLRVLSSLRAEFHYVWLYVIGGQGIIVASNSPAAIPNEGNKEILMNSPNLLAWIAQSGGGKDVFQRHHFLDPGQIDRVLLNSRIPLNLLISTDDNLLLEYSTPKGNVLEDQTPQQLLDNLLKLAERPVM